MVAQGISTCTASEPARLIAACADCYERIIAATRSAAARLQERLADQRQAHGAIQWPVLLEDHSRMRSKDAEDDGAEQVARQDNASISYARR